MTAAAAIVYVEQEAINLLKPPPKLTVSEWADQYRMLSRESSAEPGNWNTDRTPYLREIMDCMNEPTVHEIVFMKCARIGGTEAGNNMTGYLIDLDPCPILIVLPTVDDAKAFSKEQLSTMIRDTPCLASKVSDPTSRDSSNTIQSKAYPGGIMSLVGANTGTGFRRRTIRYVHLSEVDGYPPSAGTEGDQIKLAKKRTETYANYKLFKESTPKHKGLSRIADDYEHSDQRRYHVPCPECGFFQVLIWKNLKYEGLPEPMYACISCGVLIPEEQKFEMVRKGKWIPGNPGHPVRGYHINALYSPFPGARWPNLVQEWMEAQGHPEKLQTFINLALGEPWDSGGGVEAGSLQSRCEQYPAEVPMAVGLLTCGVDVQPDRLEATVIGWGPGEETWHIHREIIREDTSGKEAWEQLEEFRKRLFTHESGAMMRIHAMAVDYGYNSEMVTRFCTPRQALKVFMVKGGTDAGKPIVPRKPTTKLKWAGKLWMLGVDAAKDWIVGRMKLREPGPGYMHFPLAHWCDTEFFKQLTAERPVKVQVRGSGKWVRKYICPPNQPNEALDCFVYAVAAFHLGGSRPQQLQALSDRVQAQAVKPEEPKSEEPEPEEPVQIRRERPTRRGGWVHGWKNR